MKLNNIEILSKLTINHRNAFPLRYELVEALSQNKFSLHEIRVGWVFYLSDSKYRANYSLLGKTETFSFNIYSFKTVFLHPFEFLT